MDRRSFLLGTSGLAISQILIGCNSNKQIKFHVQLLKGSIPGQVVGQFKKSWKSNMELKFTPIDQIEELFQQLQTWRRPNPQEQTGWTRYIPRIPLINDHHVDLVPADLVTLGDYWLQAAIQQELIQPLKIVQNQSWSGLGKKWTELVKRDSQGNPHPEGEVWGAPYSWGNTAIVYNRDKFRQFDWRPQDWSDLWRKELRSHISLLNQPREVIGLVLKKLGKSYNTENLDQVPALEMELAQLNQQVKFYDSRNYLEPLAIGDTWLAVGWSNDIIPLLEHYPQMTAVIPQSGTAIWANLWVRPVTKNPKDLPVDNWINFCWEPNISKQIALLTKTNSPLSTNITVSDIPKIFQNLLLTNQDILDRSEFLLPLSTAAIKQYETLFFKMKNSGLARK
jgi:putative spermidine/putrescine transport system substrate-binding protein